MNNEELVTSLRTEINTYLKNTVADLQQEISAIQERVSAEITRHRSELENSFQELLARGSDAGVNDEFTRIVAEHLQIAHEDGARESEAQAQAANASQQTQANFAVMRDALSEISAQTTQADILKALVIHASGFAPRGAFFIVKSDHIVGWRTFGNEFSGNDDAVREVFLSTNSNTLLANAIKQNAAQHNSTTGGEANDAQFLYKLGFGEPERMVAIPLVVRNRAVAVLYADSGENNALIQFEALESLVRVASLTVELRAAVKTPTGAGTAKTEPTRENRYPRATEASSNLSTASVVVAETSSNAVAGSANVESSRNGVSTTASQNEYATFSPAETAQNDLAYQPSEQNVAEQTNETQEKPVDSFSFDTDQPVEYQTSAPDNTVSNNAASPENVESASAMPSSTVDETAFSFEPSSVASPNFNAAPSSVEIAANATPARRVSDRNPDLPVSVPEDERRLHNDARRFARLLVSEIKLYNEQKVQEGRQLGDLYNRLREAIDRSREMYDKRVSPTIAQTFDYFHYELVNTLAEGDETRLGNDYPGSTV